MERRALLVITSSPSPEAAENLAASLVEQRLAACVQCLPGVRSVYRWRGQIERGEETLLLIKTTPRRYAAVAEVIRSASSYELPEVIAVPVEQGTPDYLAWVEAAVASHEEQ